MSDLNALEGHSFVVPQWPEVPPALLSSDPTLALDAAISQLLDLMGKATARGDTVAFDQLYDAYTSVSLARLQIQACYLLVACDEQEQH